MLDCQLSAGDDRAADLCASLLNEHRGYLLAIANRELSPQLVAKVGASDLVQDTLVLGYERFGTFRGTTDEQLARWLRRILLNHLQNVEKSFATAARDVAREQSLSQRVIDAAATSPSRALVLREEWDAFQVALSRLPDELRSVILLRHRENLSFDAIGRLLGRSEATARRVWTQAVRELQLEMYVDDSRAG